VYYEGGQLFVDEDVSLESGETFSGDLGMFNGDLTVPQGSTVNGDVFVANGDADIAGRINGDLAVMNGDLRLTETGRVRGDVFGMSGSQVIAGQVDGDLSVMFGSLYLQSPAMVEGDMIVVSGSLEREAGAQVLGEEMPEIPLPDLPFVPEQPKMPVIPVVPEISEVPEMPAAPELSPPSPPHVQPSTLGQRIGRFFGRSMAAGFLSLLFVGMGLLVALVWPRSTRRVSDCIAAMPLQSFGLGLLTFLIAVVLESLALVLMVVIILIAAVMIGTVLLIPIGLLLILLSVLVLLPVPLALAAGMLLGWVGMADLVGRRALKVLGVRDGSPLGAVLAGLLITVPLAALLWVFNPGCCAWPFIILLTSVGLGAVFHTRFGTQSCLQAGAPAPSAVLPIDAMEDETGQPDLPPQEYP
jgi:cytoskeletal protein CcmA (bactofilin family)